MIRLLDLPGAPELEARLELLPWASATSDETTRKRLEAILRFLGFRFDYWGNIEAPPVTEDVSHLDLDEDDEDEDDVVALWRQRGWDIARQDGTAAFCYRLLRAAMTHIELGRRGASKVQIEAAIWKMQRDARRGPDPMQRKQDQAFLALGSDRRRRRA